MDAIALVKPLHVTLALLSGSGMLLRSLARMRRGTAASGRFERIAPHVIDTALLATGISMATLLGVSPMTPWLGAKLTAVAAYIVAGTFAVKRARTAGGRWVALLLALTLLGYIVAVALHHSPFPWTT